MVCIVFNIENVFPEIIEQLKSDMLLEINLTKEKYEDSKCNNIEKIKAKYKIDQSLYNITNCIN